MKKVTLFLILIVLVLSSKGYALSLSSEIQQSKRSRSVGDEPTCVFKGFLRLMEKQNHLKRKIQGFAENLFSSEKRQRGKSDGELYKPKRRKSRRIKFTAEDKKKWKEKQIRKKKIRARRKKRRELKEKNKAFLAQMAKEDANMASAEAIDFNYNHPAKTRMYTAESIPYLRGRQERYEKRNASFDIENHIYDEGDFKKKVKVSEEYTNIHPQEVSDIPSPSASFDIENYIYDEDQFASFRERKEKAKKQKANKAITKKRIQELNKIKHTTLFKRKKRSKKKLPIRTTRKEIFKQILSKHIAKKIAKNRICYDLTKVNPSHKELNRIGLTYFKDKKLDSFKADIKKNKLIYKKQIPDFITEITAKKMYMLTATCVNTFLETTNFRKKDIPITSFPKKKHEFKSKLLYVLTKKKDILIYELLSDNGRRDRVDHSSLTRGDHVASAGELIIDNGELIAIKDNSKAYDFIFFNFFQIIEELVKRGYKFKNVLVESGMNGKRLIMKLNTVKKRGKALSLDIKIMEWPIDTIEIIPKGEQNAIIIKPNLGDIVSLNNSRLYEYFEGNKAIVLHPMDKLYLNIQNFTFEKNPKESLLVLIDHIDGIQKIIKKAYNNFNVNESIQFEKMSITGSGDLVLECVENRFEGGTYWFETLRNNLYGFATLFEQKKLTKRYIKLGRLIGWDKIQSSLVLKKDLDKINQIIKEYNGMEPYHKFRIAFNFKNFFLASNKVDNFYDTWEEIQICA